MSRILIADDEPSIRFVLREALDSEGHEIVEACDGTEAGHALAGDDVEMAFIDIHMPGKSGLELLQELGTRPAAGPVVVIMTAQNTFDNAIEAMKLGAFDYLTKPFDLKQVHALVTKASEMRRLRGEVAALRRELGGVFRGGEAIVGSSASMLETLKRIGRIAASEATVLILGESGTGKELIARAIHYHSRRAEGPFVAVNMAALPSELIEAELFGHEHGAYTGATEARAGRFREAQAGSLLLDEVGDLPLSLQAKLLRVLQDKRVTPLGGRQSTAVDVRILAATHRDLEQMVRDGEFREDLYFRLNVVPVQIAPLRERREDIPPLVQHFVERFADELGVPRRWPTEATLGVLQGLAWPGNVRELENVIKRALVLCAGEVITPADIQTATQLGRAAESDDWTGTARREFGQVLEDRSGGRGDYWSFVQRLERVLIEEALARATGNQIQAAKLLGINRNTLRKKLTDLGLRAEPEAEPGA